MRPTGTTCQPGPPASCQHPLPPPAHDVVCLGSLLSHIPSPTAPVPTSKHQPAACPPEARPTQCNKSPLAPASIQPPLQPPSRSSQRAWDSCCLYAASCQGSAASSLQQPHEPNPVLPTRSPHVTMHTARQPAAPAGSSSCHMPHFLPPHAPQGLLAGPAWAVGTAGPTTP